MQVALRALAAADIEAAVDHCRDEAGPQVALDFVDALAAAINHLRNHPNSGSLRFAFELEIPELRSWLLPKFPYLIFYVPEDGRVDIWRVLHARRDIPAYLSSDPLR
ncbi:MAG: type II toxin-antitoxin system RelE/ParE family toxin [bacterium]|nr:type II toxin-antitoxin system RelE/ParE family toxin [bacterium]